MTTRDLHTKLRGATLKASHLITPDAKRVNIKTGGRPMLRLPPSVVGVQPHNEGVLVGIEDAARNQTDAELMALLGKVLFVHRIEVLPADNAG